MALDMTGSTVLAEIDELKRELDALRPLPSDVVGRIGQKLRLEWNYHSNALEGNSLTLGETKSLILHGLTAPGKSASVTKEDNTVASCGLSKDSRDWPQSALALSVTIRLRLVGLRGQGGKFFYFVITNTADSNRCAWRFTVADWPAAPLHEKDYMGQDLDVLKKLFN